MTQATTTEINVTAQLFLPLSPADNKPSTPQGEFEVYDVPKAVFELAVNAAQQVTVSFQGPDTPDARFKAFCHAVSGAITKAFAEKQKVQGFDLNKVDPKCNNSRPNNSGGCDPIPNEAFVHLVGPPSKPGVTDLASFAVEYPDGKGTGRGSMRVYIDLGEGASGE